MVLAPVVHRVVCTAARVLACLGSQAPAVATRDLYQAYMTIELVLAIVDTHEPAHHNANANGRFDQLINGVLAS